MDFYELWAGLQEHALDDTVAINAFLDVSATSTDPFINGTNEQMERIFTFLNEMPMEHILSAMQKQELHSMLAAGDVPCFSNFENGASRLNELLEFAPDGMTYAEAGAQLIEATREEACVKYGENHSKLARTMNLVSISPNRPAVVTSTQWGGFLTRYDINDKHNVLRKLMLRDPCVRQIISHALKGAIAYREITSALSDSTALRRRTNVKWLIEYVLTGTEYENALLQIDWNM